MWSKKEARKKKDGMKWYQTKNRKQGSSETHANACVWVLRERNRQRGGGHVGGRLMWFSLRPPEAWSSEKSWLIGEEKDGGGVVYLDMLYSVFNACITIKMLRLISCVYKTV